MEARGNPDWLRRRLPRHLAAALLLLLALGPGAGTAEAAPPAVGAVWASSVQASTARLNAEVDPGGKASSYHFDYISRTAHDANLAAGKAGFTGASRLPIGSDTAISGTVPTSIGPLLTGLAAATAYRYRLVVKNADATTTGPTRDFVTHPTAPFALPDGRGWELVSPVEKNGGQIAAPGALAGGGALQAAADGQSVTYGSGASFAAGAQGAPPASQYLSQRLAAGWLTANVSLPALSASYPEDGGSPYRLFSGDLARAVHLNVARCAPPGPCPRDYYLREILTGALIATPQRPDLAFAGASPDLRHVVLSTCAALTPGATDGCGGGEANLYLWSSGALSLVNAVPGAALAAQGAAVSADGSRVYFTDLASGDLYLRAGAQVKQADAAAGGGGTFETASGDGSVALFSKAGHLWRYDALADSAADLTPAGGVLGVLGASADGSRVYYLTASGLFLRAGAATTKVADAADASNYPPVTGTARVSADGSKLLFLSAASLTGYDNLNAASKAPEPQVYLYDATAGALTCASCNPTSGRPLGPSSIPGAIANGTAPGSTRSYKPRALSADGRRVFFDSEDALVLADVNLDTDVYQWQAQGSGSCIRAGGCVSLISSGLGDRASFVDASASGDDAFFLTDRSLVGADPGSVDLYDARVGGGFPEPVASIPCNGDACQLVPAAPEDPVLTTVLSGSGNPAERYRSYGATAAKKCPKGRVRKGKRCVKKPRKRAKAGKHGGKG